MLCARHGIAAGPDGQCALCLRQDRASLQAGLRHKDRRIHRGLRLVIGVVTFAATYALLMAWLDTVAKDPPRPGTGSSVER